MQKSQQNDRINVNIAELESSNKQKRIRVLHVDDDQCILEVSKQILNDTGNFEIDSANSVDEGFKKLSADQYDVVI